MKAERPREQNAETATTATPRGSLQRMVRPRTTGCSRPALVEAPNIHIQTVGLWTVATLRGPVRKKQWTTLACSFESAREAFRLSQRISRTRKALSALKLTEQIPTSDVVYL